MLHAPCSMSLNDYIEKLRRKPEREREKIAVIATGISFAIIFLIWLVSFNEIERSVQPEMENQPAQLEDLESNLESGKSSIEEMFQQLPVEGELEQDVGSEEETGEAQNGDRNAENNQDDQPEIPSLP